MMTLRLFNLLIQINHQMARHKPDAMQKAVRGLMQKAVRGLLRQAIDYLNERPTHTTSQYKRQAIRPGVRFDILTRDHHRCVCCGRGAEDGVKLEVDHIIPVSKGGTNQPKNLRTLCAECNRGKAAK